MSMSTLWWPSVLHDACRSHGYYTGNVSCCNAQCQMRTLPANILEAWFIFLNEYVLFDFAFRTSWCVAVPQSGRNLILKCRGAAWYYYNALNSVTVIEVWCTATNTDEVPWIDICPLLPDQGHELFSCSQRTSHFGMALTICFSY